MSETPYMIALFVQVIAFSFILVFYSRHTVLHPDSKEMPLFLVTSAGKKSYWRPRLYVLIVKASLILVVAGALSDILLRFDIAEGNYPPWQIYCRTIAGAIIGLWLVGFLPSVAKILREKADELMHPH